ncbi:Ail/Lom family outer membrane beta-barrel protein [Ewingella sp. S1.OA.A_B6]
MKALLITSALVATIGFSTFAQADNHTVSLGYAYGKADDVKLKGVDVKYRYEWDSPVSMIASFTYMKDNISDSMINGYEENGYVNKSTDVKYYSLTAGPAYRVNDYISAYALVGLSRSKIDVNLYYSGNDYTEDRNTHSTNLAYSAGVQINPIPQMVVDVAYQGSKIKGFNDYSTHMNGVVIGLGYRF